MIAGVRRYGLAYADQGMTALLSLLVTLWLIRRGSEEAFGAWVFWSSTGIVLGTAAAALTTVHLHRLPPEPPGRRTAERAILSAGLAVTAVATVGTVVAVILLGPPLSVPEAVLFVPGTLLASQARALAASRGALAWAAALSAFTLVAVVLGVAGGQLAGHGTAVGELLALNGAAQGLAGALVLRRLSGRDRPDFGRGGRRRWRVLWRRSSLTLAGGLASEAAGRLYVFLVPAMAGTAALGAIAAASTLLRPATLLTGAWAMAVRAPLAAARARGDGAEFRRLLILGAAGPAATILLLGVAVAAGWPLVSRIVYGGRFPGLEGLVLSWTLQMAIACFFIAGTVAAQAMGRLQASARADLAGAATCAATMPVLLLLFPPGVALVALSLGGVVQVAVQWRALGAAVAKRAG